MTRAELYALVWDEPMVHVARRLGMSNIGLRKVCDDHDIPTPPVGYWTKVAYGKPAERPPLPARRTRVRDQINLTFRRIVDVSNQLADNQIANFTLPHIFGDTPGVHLDKAQADELQDTAAALERTLRKQRANHDGFVHCEDANLPRVRIGQGSIRRVVVLADAFLKTLLQRGVAVVNGDEGLRVVADEEPFVFKIYETRERRRRTTGARRGPSGQLCLEISDPRPLRWNSRNLVGRWYDREGRVIEQCLGDVTSALVSASAAVKLVRANAQAQADAEAAQAAERTRDDARRERERLRREFLTTKARGYADFAALEAFAKFMATQTRRDGDEPVDRIARTLEALVEEMGRTFDRSALNAEIVRLGLFTDDDADEPPRC